MTDRRVALAYAGHYKNPPRDPTGRTAPRSYLFNDQFDIVYDVSLLDELPAETKALYRPLPKWLALAIEIHRRRDEYDAVLSWGEHITIGLMAVQRAARGGKPHIPMLYWFSNPMVFAAMLAFKKTLHAVVTWTSVQRKFAIDRLGIPPERIYFVNYQVDHIFWGPEQAGVSGGQEDDLVVTAGAEMRDYPTLIEAIRGTGLRCHIAADHVRFSLGRRINAEGLKKMAGAGVTVGAVSLPELRKLYARARFVVMPLQPSNTNHGLTVILEAMAMGKAVICSKTEGQVDVIRDGETGLLVAQGDPEALRAVMISLRNDPERARRIGAAARAYIEKYHTIDEFCHNVRAAVDASLDGRWAGRDGALPATRMSHI